uniref:Uncharacterized protein n=1 Tax=Rhizophora mucronata TaxID=61149 RepID=A0A2P2PLC8_RHIMU
MVGSKTGGKIKKIIRIQPLFFLKKKKIN